MNAACPSLACQTAGALPRARSTRTPPTPRIHSWRSRWIGPPAYSLPAEFAVLGVVRFEVGVEQVDRDPAHVHPPGADVDGAAERLDHREPRLAAGPDLADQRGRGRVEAGVAVLLPAVEPECLVEVALGVEQPDADQRHRQVRGGLAVVAGQHAEAAGVDRHRVVEPELGAEVGDRAGQGSEGRGKPGRVAALVLAFRLGHRTRRTAPGMPRRPSAPPGGRGRSGAAARPDCGG